MVFWNAIINGSHFYSHVSSDNKKHKVYNWILHEIKYHSKQLSYLQSSGSQSIVWMLNSMVLLALVTSVQWTPPDFPPVKHCRTVFTISVSATVVRKSSISTAEVGILRDYPNEPGVDGAEHGAVRHDSFVDLANVVHQPAKLHCAEVSANGEPCFMLQDDNHISQSVIW